MIFEKQKNDKDEREKNDYQMKSQNERDESDI